MNKPIERPFTTFYLLVIAIFTLSVTVYEIIAHMKFPIYSIRLFNLGNDDDFFG